MDKETLDKINSLTRRKFKAEELYTFPVTLCGNEVDRDLERFSDDALAEMAPLFIGKTIIADHNPTTDNQIARLYDTDVVTDPERLTKDGRTYKYLKGYAYTVRTASNADFITEIDAGIKKEVSVGCSSARRICSICGSIVNEVPCEHIKGHDYGGQVCCHIIDGITDAYELSFVPVPAQPDAGVTKARSQHGQDTGVMKHNTIEKGGITMEEFNTITTKAAFDAAAQPLIDAAVTAKAAEFEGYISPADHQKALDDLAAEHKAALCKAYREKAAVQYDLPAELADRLIGETEEEINADAEKLSGITKGFHGETPSFTPSDNEMDGVEKAFHEKNPNVKI